MWGVLLTLIFLSLALAISSYLFGSIPLFFTLSPRHTRLLTACGTGILVGTALIVIIPEGVETLYSARPAGAHIHHRRWSQHPWDADARAPAHIHARSSAKVIGKDLVSTVVVTRSDKDKAKEAKKKTKKLDKLKEKDQKDGKGTGKQLLKVAKVESVVDDEDTGPAEPVRQPVADSKDEDFEPHAWIGLAVITGFILMYLVDKLPKLAAPRSGGRPSYISLQGMGIRGNSDANDDAGLQQNSKEEDFKPSSTTTGLVIHGVCDGVALGASSTAATSRLSFIIFIALMIHKAPAAFGLTAVLLKQGLSKRRARAHLAVFALAAPAGALVTFLLAHILGGGSLGTGSRTTFITGLLLLFSGGTFLYVAMHTMQDSGHSKAGDHEQNGNGYADIYQPQTAKQEDLPAIVDTLVTVGGMLLPLLTLFGHHSH